MQAIRELDLQTRASSVFQDCMTAVETYGKSAPGDLRQVFDPAECLKACRNYDSAVRRYTQGESASRLAGNLQPARSLGECMDEFVAKTTMEGCIDMLVLDDSIEEVLKQQDMPHRECLAVDALLVIRDRIKGDVKQWYKDARSKYQAARIFHNVQPKEHAAGKRSGMGSSWDGPGYAWSGSKKSRPEQQDMRDRRVITEEGKRKARQVEDLLEKGQAGVCFVYASSDPLMRCPQGARCTRLPCNGKHRADFAAAHKKVFGRDPE